MTEDFKKWLTDKGKFSNQHVYESSLAYTLVLIYAMWAINREGKWYIILNHQCVDVVKIKGIGFKCCAFLDYKYSEQQALEAALLHIFKQEQGK